MAAEGLNFAYPDSPTRKVLKGVSLSVEPGSMVALIGPSGAGKSTLAAAILGLVHATSGTVQIAGQDARTFIESHPGAVSLVQQENHLVSGTIAENIALGVDPSEVDPLALEEAVGQAQLGKWVASLARGLDTPVDAGSVSGGQLQRLGLARALYTSPGLLVLDEPTSALDADTESEISKSLRALRGNVTQIVVAHRLTTIEDADKVYLLEDGSITASGTFAKLRKSSPTVARQVELLTFKV